MNDNEKDEYTSYWNWILKSWRTPMTDEMKARPWYGIVTLIWEDILLFIGIGVAGASFGVEILDVHLYSLMGAQITQTLISLMLILFLFQVVTVLCSMVGHLFIFGKVGNFWTYLNRLTQVSNWNVVVVIIAFICMLFTINSGLLGTGFNLMFLSYALFSLGSFVVVLRGNPVDEPVVHDPFFGAVIYSAVLTIAYTMLAVFFRVLANF